MLTTETKQDLLEIRQTLLECIEIGLRSYERTGNPDTLARCEGLMDWVDELSTPPI